MQITEPIGYELIFPPRDSRMTQKRESNAAFSLPAPSDKPLQNGTTENVDTAQFAALSPDGTVAATLAATSESKFSGHAGSSAINSTETIEAKATIITFNSWKITFKSFLTTVKFRRE